MTKVSTYRSDSERDHGIKDHEVKSQESDSPMIELSDVAVGYGDTSVAQAVNLTVYPGEIIALLGASGSGKSTLLRAVAGFVTPIHGEIKIAGERVSSAGQEHIPPEQRRLGMMFQDYALFPYLTVEDNIGFGLHHLSKKQRHTRIQELLELVDLSAYAKRKPNALSGGQQQRVALARALAPKPRALLLDEPFANLDGPLRLSLGHEMRRILKKERISAILVTHDCAEALGLSDRVGVIGALNNDESSSLLQLDRPVDVYRYPSTPEVALLTGPALMIQGARVASPLSDENQPEEHIQEMIEVSVMSGLGEHRCSGLSEVPSTSLNSEPVQVLLRPHQLQFSPHDDGVDSVKSISFSGPHYRILVESKVGDVWVESQDRLEIGARGELKATGVCHAWPSDSVNYSSDR